MRDLNNHTLRSTDVRTTDLQPTCFRSRLWGKRKRLKDISSTNSHSPSPSGVFARRKTTPATEHLRECDEGSLNDAIVH